MTDMPLAQQMTANSPRIVEPDDDEAGDEILFVRNGWIRVSIGGVLYKLRRPFLGELRDLEATIDHAQEELKRLADDMRQREEGDKERADAIKAEADDPATTAERKVELDEETTQLTLNLQDRFIEVERFARSRREEWWVQAFKTLTPPGHEPPPQMPAWVADGLLQHQVIQHWQSSPLARGGQ